MRPLAILAFAAAAHAYVPWQHEGGARLVRPDFANVQLYVHDSFAAGLRNSEDALLITEDSDPMAAFQAAASRWSAVPGSSVRIAPLERTPLGRDAADGRTVILAADSPELQSVVGSALAVTLVRFRLTGAILDADIVFNGKPRTPFSTTLTGDTIDLQSVLTHELGHALGANHSPLMGAAMVPGLLPRSDAQRHLSADDIAFLTEAYPAEGALAGLGAITGRVVFDDIRGVRAASVVAVNRAAGVTLQALTAADGFYRIGAVPPGDYEIYVEPFDGPARPNDVGLRDSDVDTDFALTFAEPLIVAAGSTSTVNILVPSGRAPFDVELAGLLTDSRAVAGPLKLTPGESVEVLLFGQGLSAEGAELRVLGRGMSVRPDSLRLEPRISIRGFEPPLRFTLDVAADAADLGSLVLRRENGAIAWSGALAVPPR
jgi:hypothetical protein